MIPILIEKITGASPEWIWAGHRFDMVVVLDRGQAGWALSQVPQLILTGDSADAL